VTNCSTTIGRNTYVGDGLYSWDLRLSRYFKLSDRTRLDLSFDAFNVLNRGNVDEVNSIYGSPVFCGAVPKHYNDAVTRAIQGGTGTTACPSAPPPVWLADGLLPVTVPTNPNPAFGTPRTMLNPRQLQFSAKFSF
jgi:hypothetical protein